MAENNVYDEFRKDPYTTAPEAVTLAPGQGGSFAPGAGGKGGVYSFFTDPNSQGGTLPGATFDTAPTPTSEPNTVAGRMFAPAPATAPVAPVAPTPAAPPTLESFTAMAVRDVNSKYRPGQLMSFRANPTAPEARRYEQEKNAAISRAETRYYNERHLNQPAEIARIQAQGKVESAQVGAGARTQAEQIKGQFKQAVAREGFKAASERLAAMQGHDVAKWTAEHKAKLDEINAKGDVDESLAAIKVLGELDLEEKRGGNAMARVKEQLQAKAEEAKANRDFEALTDAHNAQLVFQKMEFDKQLQGMQKGEAVTAPKVSPVDTTKPESPEVKEYTLDLDHLFKAANDPANIQHRERIMEKYAEIAKRLKEFRAHQKLIESQG